MPRKRKASILNNTTDLFVCLFLSTIFVSIDKFLIWSNRYRRKRRDLLELVDTDGNNVLELVDTEGNIILELVDTEGHKGVI